MKSEEGQQQQFQQQQEPYIPLAKNFGPFYILAGAYPPQDHYRASSSMDDGDSNCPIQITSTMYNKNK